MKKRILELHDIPVTTWYSLMVAADVDGALKENRGPLCQLINELFTGTSGNIELMAKTAKTL